jgi:hypothetical protein
MGSSGKSFVLILVIILAVSILIMAKPVFAQMPTNYPIPNFSVPEFSAEFIKASFNTTNPYTGVPQQVDNSTIQLSIKNQPLNQLFGSSTPLSYYYNVRTKGHFDADNWTVLDQNETLYTLGPSDSGNNMILGVKPSNSNYTVLSYPADYPPKAQVDFQVQAVVYQMVEVFVQTQPHNPSIGSYFPEPQLYETTDWSSTQTVAISQTSLSPTPTVPEFSWLALLPLFAVAIFVAVKFRVECNKQNIPVSQEKLT